MEKCINITTILIIIIVNIMLLAFVNSLASAQVALEDSADIDMPLQIVQHRIVPRLGRQELLLDYSRLWGGDAYIQSQLLGLQYHLHLLPHWGISVQYNRYANQLTPEARDLIEDQWRVGEKLLPQSDYPRSALIGEIYWYPIYGKLNLWDRKVLHFDLYSLLGAGSIWMRSGGHQLLTTGGGIVIWLSNSWTTRFEMKFQSHTTSWMEKERTRDQVLGSIQIGYLHDWHRIF